MKATKRKTVVQTQVNKLDNIKSMTNSVKILEKDNEELKNKTDRTVNMD